MRITRHPSCANRSVADGTDSPCSRLSTVRGVTASPDTVAFTGGCRGNEAVAHFVHQLGAVTLFRVAVPPRAARLLVIGVAARPGRVPFLVLWRDLLAIGIAEGDEMERAAGAPKQA